MATKGTELQVVGSGIHNASIAYPTKNSYVQNMIFDNEWETRAGFGVLGEWDSTLSRLNEDPGVLSKFNGYKTHLGSHIIETNFGHKQIISIFFLEAYINQGINKRNLAVVPQPTNNIIENTQQQSPIFAVSIYDITTNTRWEEILHSTTADLVPLPEERSLLGGGMPYQHGYYASNRDRSYLSPRVSFEEEPSDVVHFVEINDILYFGSKDIGNHYYKPAAFIGNRSKAIDFLRSKADCKGYSESSIIHSLKLTPGRFSARYEYLTSVGTINGLARLGTRLVYIGERRIYFSDPDRTSSVVSGHTLDIPSENTITGVNEINGNLLIWTKSETFLYQPQISFFVNNGVLTKISESIGCLSHSSHMMFENTVIWVSNIGVHSNNGGLKVATISDNIKAFFENFLSNPVSHFHLNSGVTNLPYGEQPKCQYHLDPIGITLAYSPRFGSVFINIPKERCTLVLNNNAEWSIWTYDSITKTGIIHLTDTNVIGVRQFMDCQQILALGKDLYCVGLDEREANAISNDGIQVWDPSAAGGSGAMVPDVAVRNQRLRSYFICEYGRGGGCDRNIDNEDYRYGIGEWVEMDLTAQLLAGVDQTALHHDWFDFVIGKPQIQTPGFVIDGEAITEKVALVPIQIRIPASLAGQIPENAAYPGAGGSLLNENSAFTKWFDENITMLGLQFQFDRTNWKPFTSSPQAGYINVIMKTPMETIGSGWGSADIAWAMTVQRQLRLYNFSSGAPDNNGNQIRLSWNMNNAGFDTVAAQVKAPFNTVHFPLIAETWANVTGAPYTTPASDNYCPIPALPDQLLTLCWIPFQRLNPTTAVSSMNIKNMNGWFYNDKDTDTNPGAADHYYRSRNFKWEFSSIADSVSAHKEDRVTQSVDWAYLSPPIGIDGAEQSKARGLYANISSRGLSNDPIENGWEDELMGPGIHQPQYRLFNTVVAADGSAWQGQIVDHPTYLNVQQTGIPFNPTLTSDPTAIKESYNQIWEPPTKGETSIRTRVRDSAGVMNYKVFGDPACEWGEDSAFNAPLPPDGTVLVDDPQYGVISESNSTRGQWFNWMFFGHVLDKAEKLILSSAKAVIRKVSGRRRTGHTRSKMPE